MQLRRSREAAGLTQAQLAKKCGFDPSYVSFAELARREPSEKFSRRADEVLETGGTLMLMWWQYKHTALFPGFPEYAGYEARATEVRLFEIGIIPGLFQTPAYALADLAGPLERGEITSAQAEERFEFRLMRQELLKRQAPPLVYAALDESAIRWQLGGPKVMLEQLDHLEQLALQSNVIIQILPFGMGSQRLFQSSVTLLTLPDQSRVGYVETLLRGFLERDKETVAMWGRRYDRMQVDAPTQAESLAMIRAARKELAT